MLVSWKVGGVFTIAYLILDIFSIRFAGIMESFLKFNRAGE